MKADLKAVQQFAPAVFEDAVSPRSSQASSVPLPEPASALEPAPQPTSAPQIAPQPFASAPTATFAQTLSAASTAVSPTAASGDRPRSPTPSSSDAQPSSTQVASTSPTQSQHSTQQGLPSSNSINVQELSQRMAQDRASQNALKPVCALIFHAFFRTYVSLQLQLSIRSFPSPIGRSQPLFSRSNY